jgi:hypothetical protein
MLQVLQCGHLGVLTHIARQPKRNACIYNLDFKTIDKLCKINKEFEKFIEQTEKLVTATEKYVLKFTHFSG